MSQNTGNQMIPPSLPVLEQLVRKVDSLTTLVGEICTQTLPSLHNKLESVRELLANTRKDHYVVEEVAELTGRSAYTVRRWINEKRLTAIRLRDGGPRGKLLIPRTELERLIAAGKGANVPTASLG